MFRLVYALLFGISAATPSLAQEIKVTQLFAVGDQEILLRRGISIDRDCVPHKSTKIAIIRKPQHGTIKEYTQAVYPNFNKDNARSACNDRRVDALAAYYQAKPGFKGKDSFEFAIVYFDGTATRAKIEMTVW